jgi:hypothetical protein
MVFDLHDHRDAEGRALGEHRASAHVRDAIPMALKACPYAGSRFQHPRPMNVSALKQLTRHWDDALAGIAWVRQQYLKRRSLPALQHDRDCLAVGEAIAAIPAFLTHRAERAVGDGELDPRVAALYKVIIGINRVYAILISGQMMSAGQQRAPVSAPEDIATFAETGGFLVGGEQVCAGSARQIADAVAALIAGGPPAPAAWLPPMLAPVERFLAFAHAMRRLAAAKLLFKTATTLALLELGSAPALPAALRATVEALVAAHDAPGTIRNFAATRGAEQLDRLLQGWFELAGGTSHHRGEDRAAPAPSSPAPPAVRTLVATLAALERRLLPVVADSERQLNVALGRNASRAAPGSRRLAHELGADVLGELSAAAGCDLDVLVRAPGPAPAPG